MELVDFKFCEVNKYLIKADGGLDKKGNKLTVWIIAEELYRFTETHDTLSQTIIKGDGKHE